MKDEARVNVVRIGAENGQGLWQTKTVDDLRLKLWRLELRVEINLEMSHRRVEKNPAAPVSESRTTKKGQGTR